MRDSQTNRSAITPPAITPPASQPPPPRHEHCMNFKPHFELEPLEPRLMLSVQFEPVSAELYEFDPQTTQWTVNDDTHSEANPFDVIAKARFTHADTGQTRTTELFYDGNDQWKFRFTGTKTGQWNFQTIANGNNGTTNDPDLHGHTGAVNVTNNEDPQAKGFFTTVGSKFAQQVGNDGQVQTIPFNLYRLQNSDTWFNDDNPQKVQIAADEVKAHGMTSFFVSVNNYWLQFGTKPRVASGPQGDGLSDPDGPYNPDFQTFQQLDQLIQQAHQQGVGVHLWAWGDEARKWTPPADDDRSQLGINGDADRRLQRYIAARLGPMPGWTMGYGFDLQEWVSEQQVGQWAQHMQQRMGWDHLLMARGRFHNALDVASYSKLGHPYTDALNNIQNDPERPHIFEEQDTYTRAGYHTMDWTRQHLWRYTMAGGHGGFWGRYWGNGSPQYPNPEQLRNFNEFWVEHQRLLPTMQADNAITDAFAIRTDDSSHVVAYAENTDAIDLDLSNMDGPKKAVAVDTKQNYSEIDLGSLNPQNQTINLPYASDWAVAVGEFQQNSNNNEPASVVGRHVFYNNSAFDGNDTSANAQDDGAIAPSKQPLLPGQTATFDNYTSYSRGVNGVMVDIANLAAPSAIDATDFTFKAGSTEAPGNWSTLSAPVDVSVRQGAGVNGSDRVTLTLPDGAVTGAWLQVNVRANTDTGLDTSDVFYFGNAIGESGDSDDDALVNATDFIGAREQQHGPFDPASITDRYDYNRDGLVNATDLLLARNNSTSPFTALPLITAPTAAHSADSATVVTTSTSLEHAPEPAPPTVTATTPDAPHATASTAAPPPLGSVVMPSTQHAPVDAAPEDPPRRDEAASAGAMHGVDLTHHQAQPVQDQPTPAVADRAPSVRSTRTLLSDLSAPQTDRPQEVLALLTLPGSADRMMTSGAPSA